METSEQHWTFSGVLVRSFVYTGIVISLFLPYFLKGNNSIVYNDYEAEENLKTLLNAVDFNKPNSFHKALQKISSTYYSFHVLSSMKPIQTLSEQTDTAKDTKKVVLIVQPLSDNNNLTNYIGIVFEDSQGNYKTGICKMISGLQSLPTELPSLKEDGNIQCPSGFNLSTEQKL